jgi:hypothetical protein
VEASILLFQFILTPPAIHLQKLVAQLERFCETDAVKSGVEGPGGWGPLMVSNPQQLNTLAPAFSYPIVVYEQVAGTDNKYSGLLHTMNRGASVLEL